MERILTSPLLGIVLSILAFEVGIVINKKLKSALANPLLIAIVLVILVLQVFHIPLKDYQKGGDMIYLFLGPVTAVLAITIYDEFENLKKNLFPVLAGCLVGSITSMVSVYLLSKLFGLNRQMLVSLLPKSVTTPIAVEISKNLGGMAPITVAAVVFTGIIGAIFSPILIRAFRVKDPVAVGVAIGTSSHAVGTTKALEIGELEGAMSGVAIGICGFITVILTMLL